MTRSGAALLLAALREPATLVDADGRTWSTVVALSRRHALAGRWYPRLDRLGGLDALPDGVAEQLLGDWRLAEHRATGLDWEIDRARRALAGAGIPLTVLKGAAYGALGLPNAEGRMSADLDILVPREALPEAEKALREHGWVALPQSDYDEAYFRQWMHELPPMRHRGRGTLIDVHHNILPLTSRLCPDADRLLAARVAIPGRGAYALQPVDLLLHTIVHGFFDGEFTNALRDLLDVHEVASHFAAADPGFWTALVERARELGFSAPASLALAISARHLGTTVPPESLAALNRDAGVRPLTRLVEWSIDRVLAPPPTAGARTRFAARLLQARSHLNKMPPVLLARHLAHKLATRSSRATD
ncbi:MAG: nucleotidyltransferase domain-containing protein [Gammaproteobacteria bacterium]